MCQCCTAIGVQVSPKIFPIIFTARSFTSEIVSPSRLATCLNHLGGKSDNPNLRKTTIEPLSCVPTTKLTDNKKARVYTVCFQGSEDTGGSFVAQIAAGKVFGCFEVPRFWKQDKIHKMVIYLCTNEASRMFSDDDSLWVDHVSVKQNVLDKREKYVKDWLNSLAKKPREAEAAPLRKSSTKTITVVKKAAKSRVLPVVLRFTDNKCSKEQSIIVSRKRPKAPVTIQTHQQQNICDQLHDDDNRKRKPEVQFNSNNEQIVIIQNFRRSKLF